MPALSLCPLVFLLATSFVRLSLSVGQLQVDSGYPVAYFPSEAYFDFLSFGFLSQKVLVQQTLWMCLLHASLRTYPTIVFVLLQSPPYMLVSIPFSPSLLANKLSARNTKHPHPPCLT